jgi:hypothetical protein
MRTTSFFVIFFIVVLFCSCGNQTREASNDVDSTSVEELQHEEIEKMSSLINEVSSCIDSIQIQEKMIFNNKEGVVDKKRMLVQLRGFKELLARKQAQIDVLTAKNANLSTSSKRTIQNLQKMVDFLNTQLAEKSKQIEYLEQAVNRKDVKIDELKYNVNVLTKETDYLKEQNFQQDVEMNSVYYIVATLKELKNLGLLKSNIFSKKIKNENIDKNLFKKVDKRNFKTLTFDKKSVKLLSNNPIDSYSIIDNADGTSTLKITNIDKFWNVSPYLIVQK